MAMSIESHVINSPFEETKRHFDEARPAYS
jgi:hypothetical protein